MSTTNRVGDLRAYGHSDVHIGNKNVVVQAPERPETPPKPSSFIPFCRDSRFVERKTILDRIQQACSASPSRAALAGLGGVGKSQLAIEQAYRVRDAFRKNNQEIWVFWVHAGTRARVEQGFKAIADAVKICGRNQPNADILQLVYQWLCNEHNGQWLMVLDSADDANVFYHVSQDRKQSATAREETKALSAYLPQSSNGSIIITTRNKDLAFRLTGHHSHVIEVGPMNRTDALALLKTKSGSQFDEVSGIELVEALGHMPLAIGQAAAYIQQRAPRTSVKKYLEEFRRNEQKQLSLLNHDSGDLRRDPDVSNSVITTWQISFEYIRSQRRTATELLSLMSFFDCQGIQDHLVQPNPQNKNHDYKAHSNDESISISEISNDAFEEDIAALQNYSLISTNETGDTFEMHGLVQLSTRKWLDTHKETEKFKMQCISRLARVFPEPEFSNWPACRKLFPHVEQAALYDLEDKESQQLEDFQQMLYYGGWYSSDQGRYAAAETMLQKAIATAKKVFDAEDNMANAMNTLAFVYMRQKRWKLAEQLFRETLKIREAVLEPDHPSILLSMSSLASAYLYQGLLDVAELEFAQLIKKEEMVLGPEHPYTLMSMQSLAFVYRNQKRWQEAELLLVQVVEVCKRVQGPEHPDTLSSMYNIASTYTDQERWQEAELLLVQHPNTLSNMYSLTFIYADQERWQEAELLLVQVVEMRRRVLGPEHPDTLNSMYSLASAYNKRKRWQEAELLLVEVIEVGKRVKGPEHPDTLNSISELADSREGLGYRDEAIQLMEQCAQVRTRVLGHEHSDTQWSLSILQYWRAGKAQTRERR
ncbi:P-loop containing nucleoside triphosphate hydrolase protein [Xylaria castorea]|nr:P-loop containing nucleoside triphosphate hydrolase protein [Xylaria castorea]